MRAREVALQALIAWQQNGTFLWDFIEQWKKDVNPEKRELDFAYELACQTVRLFGYLEFAAKKFAKRPKKSKERLVLYLGIYQRLFLTNIPVYAVVDSMVDLAKKYCSQPFANFINAALRQELTLDSELVVALHSYPEFFKNKLQMQYGKQKMIEILLQLNRPSIKMATTFDNGIKNQSYDIYPENCYIQNCTPVNLVTTLAKTLKKAPKRILDLCAAPGGKTILLSHLFANSEIFAHDLEQKLPRLLDNLNKFAPQVKITSEFSKYDLILVDAPCSNSGVLYKCPEARHRLSEQSLKELENLQLSLIKQACNHLAPEGHIWYMTCSILTEENEAFVSKLCQEFSLQLETSLLLLPEKNGQEGGFAASLVI